MSDFSKKRLFQFLLCTLVVTIAGAGGLFADEAADKGKKRENLFDKLDKDKNGQLTIEEVGEEKKRFFERLIRNGDTNKDSQLSKEEFQSAFKLRRNANEEKPGKGKKANKNKEGKPGDGKKKKGPRGPRPGMQGGLIKELDKDGDNMLTLEEVKGLKKAFQKLDKNQDGKLNLSELHGRPSQGKRPGKQGAKPGEGKGKNKKGNNKGDKPDIAARGKKLFERFDKDANGTLSKEEAPGPMKKRFDKIDADGNGEITLEEFKEAAPKRDGRGKKGKGKNKQAGKKADAEENKDPGF